MDFLQNLKFFNVVYNWCVSPSPQVENIANDRLYVRKSRKQTFARFEVSELSFNQ